MLLGLLHVSGLQGRQGLIPEMKGLFLRSSWLRGLQQEHTVAGLGQRQLGLPHKDPQGSRISTPADQVVLQQRQNLGWRRQLTLVELLGPFPEDLDTQALAGRAWTRTVACGREAFQCPGELPLKGQTPGHELRLDGRGLEGLQRFLNLGGDQARLFLPVQIP